jgi:hypothetical protein
MNAATTVAEENRSTPPWIEITRCQTTCRHSAENPVTANKANTTCRDGTPVLAMVKRVLQSAIGREGRLS